jgi:hypothetical protein
VQRETYIANAFKRSRHISNDVAEEAIKNMDTFSRFCNELIESIETAYGVIQGLPAVIKGDRRIYELKTMPVAPLMRREDGLTIKQYMYRQVTSSAGINENTNTNNHTQQVNLTANALAPQSAAVNLFRSSSNYVQDTSTPTPFTLITHSKIDNNKLANSFLIKSLVAYYDGDTCAAKKAYTRLYSYQLNIRDFNTIMKDVIVKIISQKMLMNAGAYPSGDEMSGLIRCVDNELNLGEVLDIFVRAMTSETELENFFKLIKTHDEDKGERENK